MDYSNRDHPFFNEVPLLSESFHIIRQFVFFYLSQTLADTYANFFIMMLLLNIYIYNGSNPKMCHILKDVFRVSSGDDKRKNTLISPVST